MPADVIDHVGGRRGREREDGRLPEPTKRRRDLKVGGSEIVAPMRNAMRLVHDRQRDLLPAQELHEVVVGKPLGRRVDELRLAGADFGDETRLLALGQAAI